MLICSTVIETYCTVEIRGRQTDCEGGRGELWLYSQRSSVSSLKPTSVIGCRPARIINVEDYKCIRGRWGGDQWRARDSRSTEVFCRVLLWWYVHLYLQQLGLIYSNQSLLYWEINSSCHRGPVVLEIMTIKKMCRKYMAACGDWLWWLSCTA